MSMPEGAGCSQPAEPSAAGARPPAGYPGRRILQGMRPLVGVAALFLAGGAVADETRESLRDPEMRDGFVFLAPKAGDNELGRVRSPGASDEPVWQLAQWHSRFPLTNAVPTEPAALCVSNITRWFSLEHTRAGQAILTLGVDSRPAYQEQPRRSAQEPWVHLLLQQAIQLGWEVPGLNRVTMQVRGLSLRVASSETAP